MFSIMQKKTASTKPRQDRRGANSIQLAPDLSERLGTVKGIAGTATKAHLARLALEIACSKGNHHVDADTVVTVVEDLRRHQPMPSWT